MEVGYTQLGGQPLREMKGGNSSFLEIMMGFTDKGKVILMKESKTVEIQAFGEMRWKNKNLSPVSSKLA